MKLPEEKSDATNIGEALGVLGATLAFMLDKISELENRLDILERAVPHDPYPNKGAGS